MFKTFGLPELLVILAIIMLLFGVGRVSRIGKELGSAISSFRKGLNEGKEGEQPAEDSRPEKV
jgi:sec-independent protein translocase protein TatA